MLQVQEEAAQELSAIDDPYPAFKELRENHPVFHSRERDLWVVSRYDDVMWALRQPEIFSSAMEMQLALFDECKLDDESGRCKALSEAIDAMKVAHR